MECISKVFEIVRNAVNTPPNQTKDEAAEEGSSNQRQQEGQRLCGDSIVQREQQRRKSKAGQQRLSGPIGSSGKNSDRCASDCVDQRRRTGQSIGGMAYGQSIGEDEQGSRSEKKTGARAAGRMASGQQLEGQQQLQQGKRGGTAVQSGEQRGESWVAAFAGEGEGSGKCSLIRRRGRIRLEEVRFQ
ncbi:hypothetical protein LXL04_008751 [Taraxacum kok-saghyz]